jgi:protein gp37
MAETAIEWADFTFNPWIGCQKVSPGCDNCYAEARDQRFHGGVHWGPHAKRQRTSPTNWKLPLKWDRQAEKEGRRFRVFCASLADVFDNQEPESARTDLWELIRSTPSLDWQILTKRPENIRYMAPLYPQPLPNVWLGTSVEDRERKRRIDILRETPAALRFLSIEPLLEDLGEIDLTGIGWVIVGGESGPGARPFDIEWARSIIAQCKAAGVPVFMKQLGATPIEAVSPGNPVAINLHLKHPKGNGMAEWPADLRVREFPRPASQGGE